MVHIHKKKHNVGTQEVTNVRTYLLAIDEKSRLTFFFFNLFIFDCAGSLLLLGLFSVEAHGLPPWWLFLLRSTGSTASRL